MSPHEMVYGKNFSDALDDLKDEFVGSIEPHDKKMKKHVMAYMKE